jgi:hypothetical protein
MIKKILLVTSLLLVSGCETLLPVKVTFPVAPSILMEDCDPLEKAKDDAQLSDLLITVTNNYTKYHECAEKKKELSKWYTEQKAIFDKVGK